MKKSTSGRQSAQKSGNPASPYIPAAGDLIAVDFAPTIGTEQSGQRFAVVVTDLAYNAKVGRCFACPTTGTPKGYPFEVVLPAGLQVHGGILSDQGRPIDWRARKIRFVGTVPGATLDDVRAKLKALLGIS
jgi:mRNA interferase MazF